MVIPAPQRPAIDAGDARVLDMPARAERLEERRAVRALERHSADIVAQGYARNQVQNVQLLCGG